MKIHKLSDVQTRNIGEGTKIWQYCVVLADALIGKNCNICSHCFIENNVVIGDRVTIKNSVIIYDNIHIEDDVFIGPGVIFTNDIYPRSIRNGNNSKIKFPKTIIRKGASIGGGSLILPGIEIGKKAIVGAGAVVTKNVADESIVYGSPAKFKRNIEDVRSN